jgi:DNA-directed RNA polymerase I subunit RPA49
MAYSPYCEQTGCVLTDLQRMSDRRADLTTAFGTKKAKDVIKNDMLNKISTQKDTDKDPASKAIMDTIGEGAVNMATQEQLQAAVAGAKPVPPPNLEAEEIQDVYDPQYLLGPEVLNMVPISDWQDAVARGEVVHCASRFVAKRVVRIATGPDPVPRLRLLRYLLWMISFLQASRPGARGMHSVPPREKLRELLAPAPDSIIDSLRRNFSEGTKMRKFHLDCLMTYSCVFALILDNFEMDSLDLREDLRLEPKAIDTYFHEIGAKTKIMSDKSSGKAVNKYKAKLSLPLRFPKQRTMGAKRR